MRERQTAFASMRKAVSGTPTCLTNAVRGSVKAERSSNASNSIAAHSLACSAVLIAKTLLIAAARWFGMDCMDDMAGTGQLLAATVDIPGVGWP